jgi:hypothetical protein
MVISVEQLVMSLLLPSQKKACNFSESQQCII